MAAQTDVSTGDTLAIEAVSVRVAVLPVESVAVTVNVLVPAAVAVG
jgi:hypothetical protein